MTEMGCQLSSFDGKCEVWDEGLEQDGVDVNGNCVCDDDPDPSYTCDQYMSDWECPECGQDCNVEECNCE